MEYDFRLTAKRFVGNFSYPSVHKVWEFDFWNNDQLIIAMRKFFQGIPENAKLAEIDLGSFTIEQLEKSENQILYRIQRNPDCEAWNNADDVNKDEAFSEQFSGTDYWLEIKKDDPMVWFLHFRK